MAANALSKGAEVYSADGKKLGKVAHFFSAAPGSMEVGTPGGAPPPEIETYSGLPEEHLSPKFDDTPRSVLTPGTGPGVKVGESDTKYCEVHHGGHLHIGGESLYVPFSAINLVEEDGSVVLRDTADQAVSRYSQKPAVLDGE